MSTPRAILLLPLLGVLLLATPLRAQSNVVVTATTDKATVLAGEPIEVTVVITKTVPGLLTDVRLSIDFVRGSLFVETTVPDGWTCVVASGRGVQCTVPELGDTPVRFVARGFAPDRRESWEAGYATLFWRHPEGGGGMKQTRIPLTIRQAASVADLTMAVAGPTTRRIGEASTFSVSIGNQGPEDATNVWARFGVDGLALPAAPAVFGGGWNCSRHNGGTVCMRSLLEAGETSVLTMELPAVDSAGTVTLHGSVFAEKSHDPDWTDSYFSRQVFVGNAEDYERVLIPIAPTITGGANGSLWRSEVSAFIDSEVPIAHYTTCIEDPICMPVQIPLRRPFPVMYTGLITNARQQSAGSFAAFRRDDAAKVRFNIRVHDEARDEKTWGVEIPAVRDSEFSTGRLILMPLPFEKTLRHTLRIYSDGLLPAGEVLVRVMTGDSPEPLATSTHYLVTPPGAFTPAQLPVSPGYAQLDPLALVQRDLSADEEFWIEIEPLTPGLRFWAFVTLTNNETSQVTTVTPQP